MFPRILMNEHDGSPGGGGPPSDGAGEAASSPAGGGIDTRAIIREVSNGVFAELRRAGVFARAGGGGGGGSAGAPSPPAAQFAPAPTPTGSVQTTTEMLQSLVQMQVAQTLKGMAGEPASASARPGRPVSDAGAPSGARVTEDTPLLRMSPEDRAHLIRTKGYTWFRQRLQQELRGVQVFVGRR